uniref:zinc ribbon domain-containing protein n=1 Tax=Okeania sp. SIO2F4 TaxID=2607790 RepID=UPI00341D53C4
MRTFLEGKAEKYGRDFRVISRWEPTSQKSSNCGFQGGKLDLSRMFALLENHVALAHG